MLYKLVCDKCIRKCCNILTSSGAGNMSPDFCEICDRPGQLFEISCAKLFKEQTRPRTQRDMDDINKVLFSAVHPVPEGRVRDSNITP